MRRGHNNNHSLNYRYNEINQNFNQENQTWRNNWGQQKKSQFLKPMFFKTLKTHILFSQIKQILQKISQETMEPQVIISCLTIFNFLIEKQSNIEQQSKFLDRQKLIKSLENFIHEYFHVENIFRNQIYDYKINSFISQLKNQFKNFNLDYSCLRLKQNRVLLPVLFGKAAKFILQCQKKQMLLPILQSSDSSNYTFSEEQILYIICLMTFNLIPQQEYDGTTLKKNYNRTNNFGYIFSSQSNKTTFIIEYLKRALIDRDLKNPFHQKLRKKNFQIKRQCTKKSVRDLIYESKNVKLCSFELLQDSETIQNYYGEGKVDFANKYIGGGVLRNGCVQEEIMYLNHPQLFASIVLCQSLKDNEALLYKGFKKYFKNTGYGPNTKFAGKQNQIQKDQFIVAIDALDFSKNDSRQFSRQNIDREILKAYTGFKCTSEPEYIVTGNWGCGAFSGDIGLKLIIQWIACSLAGKKIKYCPFGKKYQIRNQLQNLARLLNNLQEFSFISIMYQHLILVCQEQNNYHRQKNVLKMLAYKFNSIYENKVRAYELHLQEQERKKLFEEEQKRRLQHEIMKRNQKILKQKQQRLKEIQEKQKKQVKIQNKQIQILKQDIENTKKQNFDQKIRKKAYEIEGKTKTIKKDKQPIKQKKKKNCIQKVISYAIGFLRYNEAQNQEKDRKDDEAIDECQDSAQQIMQKEIEQIQELEKKQKSSQKVQKNYNPNRQDSTLEQRKNNIDQKIQKNFCEMQQQFGNIQAIDLENEKQQGINEKTMDSEEQIISNQYQSISC